MSTTITGIPRVKAARVNKARPLDLVGKRSEVYKKTKAKADPDDPNDPLNAWKNR